MSKNKIAKVLIALNNSRLKVPQLGNLAFTVFTAFTAASAIFTTPPVLLAIFKQDIDNMMAAASAALNGSKKDIAERNKYRHIVEMDLNLLGAYAEKIADGDAAILTASGFPVAPPRTISAPQPLTMPAIKSIKPGNSGEQLVRTTAVKKARSYDVQYGAFVNGVPATWITITFTNTRNAVSITGLTPGTNYAFRVRALGKLGYTDWSDYAIKMST